MNRGVISVTGVLLVYLLMLSSCELKQHITNNQNTTPAELLTLRWQYRDHGLADMDMPIDILDDSSFIFAEGLFLSRIQVRTGKVSWTTQIDNKVSILGDYLLHDDSNIYGMHVRDFRGWNIDTGEEVWRFTLPDSIDGNAYTGHALCEGKIYVTTADYILSLIPFDDMTGLYAARGYPSTILCQNGIIYYANEWHENREDGLYETGSVTALEPLTGDTIWTFTPLGTAPSYTAPLLSDQTTVYVGSCSASGKHTDLFRTYAIDAQDGHLVWKTSEQIFTYHQILVGDTIYGNNGIGLYALDKHTGALLWQNDLGVGHGERPIAYWDGYLYHAKGGALHVVDARTGEIVISRMLGPDKSSVRVASAGAGAVFVQTNQHLYCYEPYQPKTQ